MNYHAIFLLSIMAIAIPLMIICLHDSAVQGAKTDQIIKNIRANETCAELKVDMQFTDQENEGVWIKSSYDPDVLKYYKEKHCQ